MRKSIFMQNLKEIELHNYLFEKGMKHYKMGVNEFSDMVIISHATHINTKVTILKRKFQKRIFCK